MFKHKLHVHLLCHLHGASYAMKILAPIYSCVQIYSFGYHNIRLVIIVINFTVYLLRVMIDLKLQITFLGPDQGFSPYTGSKLGIMFQSLQYKK